MEFKPCPKNEAGYAPGFPNSSLKQREPPAGMNEFQTNPAEGKPTLQNLPALKKGSGEKAGEREKSI